MEEKAKQQKRKIRRRYQSFINLAKQPDYSPQYALTSFRRRNEENNDNAATNAPPDADNDEVVSHAAQALAESVSHGMCERTSSKNDCDMEWEHNDITNSSCTAEPSTFSSTEIE